MGQALQYVGCGSRGRGRGRAPETGHRPLRLTGSGRVSDELLQVRHAVRVAELVSSSPAGTIGLLMRVFFSVWSCLALAAAALATGDNPLAPELVAQNTSISAGRPFYVGLHLQHPEGYHTYWKYPGIVGIPTAIQWHLPEGWSAGPIEWPAPERVLMFQIKAQGFHGELVLPVKITPPENLAAGTTVTLQGRAQWMCCGRQCHPGFKELDLQITVEDGPAHPDPRWSALFQRSLDTVAQTCLEWSASAERSGQEIVLGLQPVSKAAKAQFAHIQQITFFTEDGLVDPNKPESLQKTEAGFILKQTISKFAPEPFPTELVGILQTRERWLPTKDSQESIHIRAAIH